MGRYTSRNYSEFTDGEWHDVNVRQYPTDVNSFRSAIQQWAKNNGGRFITHKISDDTLSIRFVRQTPGGHNG